MADVFGAILSFLGAILNAIYKVIPSYGVAIILITILVRLALFPLAVKQIKSMTAMQRIQPKLKELQKKHKGDRQKLNEEMMKLYKEHNVNPLGGCFPMILQLPVFIALYAVFRVGVPFVAPLATEAKITLPVERATACRIMPAEDIRKTVALSCRNKGKEETIEVTVKSAKIPKGHDTGKTFEGLPGYVTNCVISGHRTDTSTKETFITELVCQSPLGTGHLPKDGKLFRDVVNDKATFLGMHLACSPTQATSKTRVRECTAATNAAGGPGLVTYYLLVALMVGTTYYQQKQMLAKQGQQSPQAQQMQMMAKIMPVFMGFLSLNFPAALSTYWVVGNFWMIGQQHFILKAQGGPPDGGTPAVTTKSGKPKPAAPNGRPGGKRPSGRPGKSRR